MIAKLEVVTGFAPAGWDELVARLGGSLFHSAVWAAYQRETTGASPLFMLGRDEKGQSAAGALALFRQSQRPLVSLIVRDLVLPAHPFAAAGDPAVARAFVTACEACARARGCARMSLDSFAGGDSVFVPSAAGYVESQRIEFRLDLSPDLGSLWSRVGKDQREKIRRQGRDGVTIDTGISLEDCLALGRAREATQANRAAKGLGYELPTGNRFYEQLYAHLVKPGATRLFLARHRGEVVGGLFFGVFGGRAYSMFSGSTDAGYRLGVQSGLFWTAVETLKAEGFHELNRGGVPASAEQESDPLHGIYLFKLRLGTTPQVCRSGRKVLSPWRDRIMRLRERRWRP